jgi:hypothetical protein
MNINIGNKIRKNILIILLKHILIILNLKQIFFSKNDKKIKYGY